MLGQYFHVVLEGEQFLCHFKHSECTMKIDATMSACWGFYILNNFDFSYCHCSSPQQPQVLLQQASIPHALSVKESRAHFAQTFLHCQCWQQFTPGLETEARGHLWPCFNQESNKSTNVIVSKVVSVYLYVWKVTHCSPNDLALMLY